MGTKPPQRAATFWTQAMLVLLWLIDATYVKLLARDARNSQVTAYRTLGRWTRMPGMGTASAQ